MALVEKVPSVALLLRVRKYAPGDRILLPICTIHITVTAASTAPIDLRASSKRSRPILTIGAKMSANRIRSYHVRTGSIAKLRLSGHASMTRDRAGALATMLPGSFDLSLAAAFERCWRSNLPLSSGFLASLQPKLIGRSGFAHSPSASDSDISFIELCRCRTFWLSLADTIGASAGVFCGFDRSGQSRLA